MKFHLQNIHRSLHALTVGMMAVLLCACSAGGTTSSQVSSQKTTAPVTGEAAGGDASSFPFKPKVILPTYETADSIVALADVVTDYGADPTGKHDSTAAINNALTAVGLAGGGTVWMPKGQYLVSGALKVPSLVTLRGDWQDPDVGTEYGTVLIAKVPSKDAIDEGLIIISASAGVDGLTVYYPEQDIKNVKPYPATFFCTPASRALRNIKNCTLINSYRGVYVGDNDSTRIRNLKGTVLSIGLEAMETHDVGVFEQISFTPDYWANCRLEGVKAASKAELIQYCKKNATGLLIRDVEQQQFANITLSGFQYGVRFPSDPARFMGSGPWYDIKITDCVYGIYANSGTYESTIGYAKENFPILTGIDWRWGYNFSNCTIAGDKYSIYNGSSTITHHKNGKQYTGYIRMTDVTLKGATHGKVEYTTLGKTTDLSDYAMEQYRTVKTTGSAFEWLCKGATEQQIQAALNKVSKAGGGIVYLAAGNYEIANGLTVSKNTELIGAAASAQRIPNMGTVLWCRQQGSQKPQTDAKALVSLTGENAGISGIYLMYDENIKSVDKDGTYKYFPFALYGNAKGVYAVDCAVSGPSHGIRFENCDDYVIEDLVIACTVSNIELSGNNGMMRNVLGNATVMYRTNGMVQTNESETMFKHFYNSIGRISVNFVSVGAGKDQKIYNIFVFGCKNVLISDGAENLQMVNLCSDNISGALHRFESGSATIINTISTTGPGYTNNGASVHIYNRQVSDIHSDHDIEETAE